MVAIGPIIEFLLKYVNILSFLYSLVSKYLSHMKINPSELVSIILVTIIVLLFYY